MGQEWDAVVVGAGLIGLSVGHELARRGLRTAILEERTIASGATQASAGVLAPHIEAPDEGPLRHLTSRSLSLYDQFVATVEHDSGLRIEYRRTGSLEIATSADSVSRLSALAEALEGEGISAQWISGGDAVRLEPALAEPQGALVIPMHGYVRVMQLVSALAAAIRERGGTVLEGRRVEDVAVDQSGFTVTAGGESHRSAALVVAAGSWAGLVPPSGGPDVFPTRGQLLQLTWTGPGITRVLWSEFCYVVPWTDGTVLVGATVEDAGFDQRTTGAGVRGLLEAASRLLPAAGDSTFVEARAGLRPSTADGLPFVGRSPAHPRLFYATGHYRNGVLLAPLTARLLADLIVNDRSDPALALMAPGR
jgi:glycine oxidase